MDNGPIRGFQPHLFSPATSLHPITDHTFLLPVKYSVQHVLVKYFELEKLREMRAFVQDLKCGLGPFLLLFSIATSCVVSKVQTEVGQKTFLPSYRKLDGTCGFTTFTREVLHYEDAICDAIYQQNNALCFPLISGCDLKWNWIHHWHSHGEQFFAAILFKSKLDTI